MENPNAIRAEALARNIYKLLTDHAKNSGNAEESSMAIRIAKVYWTFDPTFSEHSLERELCEAGDLSHQAEM
jgi:hypothetical protein